MYVFWKNVCVSEKYLRYYWGFIPNGVTLGIKLQWYMRALRIRYRGRAFLVSLELLTHARLARKRSTRKE
jgi:hypothetical protein